MAEKRTLSFDNTEKFIEPGYHIAYYRKHMGAIEAPTSAALSPWTCCSTSQPCWTSGQPAC